MTLWGSLRISCQVRSTQIIERLTLAPGLVKEICGSHQVQYHPHGRDKPPIVIDFTPPFRVISPALKLAGWALLFFSESLCWTVLRNWQASKSRETSTRKVTYSFSSPPLLLLILVTICLSLFLSRNETLLGSQAQGIERRVCTTPHNCAAVGQGGAHHFFKLTPVNQYFSWWASL